jgi:hypothetical protein
MARTYRVDLDRVLVQSSLDRLGRLECDLFPHHINGGGDNHIFGTKLLRTTIPNEGLGHRLDVLTGTVANALDGHIMNNGDIVQVIINPVFNE